MAKYRLFYAGLDTPNGVEQIGVAYSDDLSTWTRPVAKPVVPIGLSGISDAAQTSNPFVLRDVERYRMWYQGKAADGLVSICYADSDDGLTWRGFPDRSYAPQGARTGEFREGYQHPHILVEEGKYHMWFSIQREGKASIAHASSDDGFSWSAPRTVLSPQEAWEGPFLYYPFVRKTSAGYELWYTGRAPGRLWRIGRAVSKDGITFVRDNRNPLLPGSDSFSFLRTLPGRAASVLDGAFPALFGSASPFIFSRQGNEVMFTHDSGPRGRLSISLYGSHDGLWKPIRHRILREGAQKWDAYFQADPFLVI